VSALSPANLTGAIGLAAAACTTFAFLPQVVRTIRTRDTSGISFWTYLIFCTGVALWLAYGLLRGDVPVIAANSVTLLTAGTVLVLKIRAG
jgi:MtN3 and saliva related transmembrane protein